MTRTYMIRHARPSSTWGDADPDPGLDEQGRAQAVAAAERLLALPADGRPRRVVSSPLRRCRETAEPFARAIGVEVEIDPRFGEIPTPAHLAPDERGPWLQAAFALKWADIKGDLDYEAWRRAVGQGLIDHAGSAVFSHFVAINGAATLASGLDQAIAFRPDHASISVFDIEGGRLILVERGREAETQVL
jgi:broad specificity phosphatase PhoE